MPEAERRAAQGGHDASRVPTRARPPAPAPTRGAPNSLGGPRSAPSGVTAGQAISLQQAAGNKAVSNLLDGNAQRVAITEKPIGETLYNTSDNTGPAGAATGKAGARHYGITAKYDMTRQGDSGVTVTVRIKFLSQARNSVPPPANAPPETPKLGQLLGKPTEIPANDPDNRRAWATQAAADGVKAWAGKLILVGEEWNLTEPNTKKRLPVTFNAVPVFGLDDEADNQVIVHPSSTVAGTPGQPIDAGNYYLNKGTYSADEKLIAAHEYGHLIGIPDEYSQSNEQLNALIHQAAPAGAPSARAALDRSTVERMVLTSLQQPLYDQLGTAMPTVTDALRGKRAAVKEKMAAAARTGVIAAAVRDQLRAQLTAASEPGLSPSIPQVVAFQTTSNFSNKTNAGEGVESGFSAAALSTQIKAAYWDALQSAHKPVAVAGLGDVSINVKSSVGATTAAGGAQAAPGAAVASSTVGPAASAGPGLPAIAPPAGLISQLAALPTTWAAAGSVLETGVTADKFAAKMESVLKSAAEAAATPLPAGVAPPAKMARAAELYRKAYALVTNASQEASKAVATELVGAVVSPVLAASVTSLQSSIAAEVTRVMTTPPSGVAALGPADPNMAALVSGMKARLDADKAATAGTGRDPLGKTGGTAPGQDVTYSYQGMMGSNNTRAVRPDQFAPMVAQFNDKLTTTFEKKFTAEVT